MSGYEHFRRIAEDPQSVEKHLEAAAEDSRNSHDDADADAKSLMRFLVEAAAEGSIVRYRLIWPDLIRDAEANSNRDYNDPKPRRGERAMLVWACQCAVEASFAVALVRGFDKIVQHVLYHFKNPFYGWKPGKTASALGAEDFRSKTPSMLLRHAAAYAGKDLVAHILRDEDCVKPKELEAAIYAAARADRLDTVEMIVAHLMTLEKGEPRCLWGSVKLGRYATLDEQRLEVVGTSFSIWPSKTMVQGQRILLGLFFQLVHAVYTATPDCEDVIAIKRALDEEWALLLSRDQCFKILAIGMPPKIKASIFKNLRIIDRAMPPDSILIKTDGEPFVAQRDLLCYWSKYFAGLSRHAWVDGAAVDFGYHIHPVVMKSVLNFMYCGEYVDVDCANKHEFLTQIWEAADYLQIDSLKEIVGLLVDRFEEEEEL